MEKLEPNEFRFSDASFWYLDDLKARVVSESGNAKDRFHIGKILLRSLRDAPEFVCQIDTATEECETNGSVLARSVRCAISMKEEGLQLGDVVVYMAPNHLHLAIPLYAAFYVGLVAAPIDITLKGDDLEKALDLRRPKIIFCQCQDVPEIERALKAIDIICRIVTFDECSYHQNFSDFLEIPEEFDVNDFRATDFDPDESTAALLPTSGTTGTSKASVETHKSFSSKLSYLWLRFGKFPTPVGMAVVLTPLQWVTSLTKYLCSAIFRNTRLQCSEPLTLKRIFHLINTYRPTSMVITPTILHTLLDPVNRDKCDFSCFEIIGVSGAAIWKELVEEIKVVMPKVYVINVYGLTETGVITLGDSKPNSCGPVIPGYKYKLMDIYTQQEIRRAHVHGELWVKGPALFKGYFNDPIETKNAFAEDGWFKTGDIFYSDIHSNMYYVERIKLLLKHYTNKIMCNMSPVEIENVIRRLPGVLDVGVTGIPDPTIGDLPVACVVRRPGYEVDAEDVKDIVRDSLPDPKHLRGGVIFVDKLPHTPSSKVDRSKLRKIVLVMERN